jgi:hypothetical protein
MRDGRTKNDLSAKLSTYINQVCSDPTDNNQHYLKVKVVGMRHQHWVALL